VFAQAPGAPPPCLSLMLPHQAPGCQWAHTVPLNQQSMPLLWTGIEFCHAAHPATTDPPSGAETVALQGRKNQLIPNLCTLLPTPDLTLHTLACRFMCRCERAILLRHTCKKAGASCLRHR
jgi:hypothetical protein